MSWVAKRAASEPLTPISGSDDSERRPRVERHRRGTSTWGTEPTERRADPRRRGDAEGTVAVTDWVSAEMAAGCRAALRRMGAPSLERIGITSSQRGEGRSSVASAMAAIYGLEYERRTLLVEFDLGSPSAAARFDVPASPGVSEILREGAAVGDAVCWKTEYLGVIPAGGSNGLTRGRVRASAASELIDQLSVLTDVIIFDLPPVSDGAEVAQLSDLCDALALVVRSGQVTKRQVEAAAASLPGQVYVVMNGTRSATPGWVRRLLGVD